MKLDEAIRSNHFNGRKDFVRNDGEVFKGSGLRGLFNRIYVMLDSGRFTLNKVITKINDMNSSLRLGGSSESHRQLQVLGSRMSKSNNLDEGTQAKFQGIFGENISAGSPKKPLLNRNFSNPVRRFWKGN